VLRPQPLSRVPELPVTAGLAGLALAVGLAQVFMKGAAIDKLYLTEAAFWSEPWRMVTCVLPHGDPLHLAFNLYWLWVFGAIVETRYGHLKTLGLMLIFALGSGPAEFATGVGGIGLSGVGYGLFGLVFALSRKDRQLLGVMDDGTVKLFVGWFFFCIVATYAHIMAIANVAHGMGAFLGVAAGLAIAKPPHGWPKGKAWVPWLGGLGVVVGVALPLVLASQFRFRSHLLMGDEGAHQAALSAQDAFERGDFRAALAGYQRAAELAETNADYWYNVAVTYQRLDDWGPAVEAYGKAAELAPEKEQFQEHYHAAQRHYAVKLVDSDPARAEAMLEEMVAASPDDGKAWWQLAYVRGKRGDTEGAKEAQERARALSRGQ